MHAATAGARASARQTDIGEGAPWTERAQRWAPVLAMAVACYFVWRVMSRGSWDTPFFFDEMWRVDMIRSPAPVDRMLTHDTPVAIGWVLVMKVLAWPFGDRPAGFRLLSVACFVAWVGVVAHLLCRIGGEGPIGAPALDPTPDTAQPGDGDRARPPGSPVAQASPNAPAVPVLVAAGAAALTAAMPGFSEIYGWFENYTFEALWVAVMLWCATALDRSPRSFGVLAAMIAAAPLFLVGGLLAVPAIGGAALLWAWRGPQRVRRVGVLVAAGALATVTAAVIAATIYRPVSSGASVQTYWIDQGASIGGTASFADLLATAWRQLLHNVAPQQVPGATGALGAVVIVGSLTVGAVVAGRRRPLLLAVVASGWALAVAASFTIHWPMTLERVNFAFVSLLYLLVAFGFLHALGWVVTRVAPRSAGPVAAALVLATFVAYRPVPVDVADDVFAKRLPADLQVIVETAAPRNLVIAYHFMSHFYVDDRLVNGIDDGRVFEVLREQRGDRSLYGALDALVADRVATGALRDGDLVWCVVPPHVGPDDTASACAFTDPRLHEVVRHRGDDALVIGLRLGPP